MLDDDPWYATDIIMTVADEHREWHRLNGPPESTVCPWDCYDPPEPDRCPACGAYVNDDGTCSDDTPEHDEKMADHLSDMLELTAEVRVRPSSEIDLPF